MNRVGRRALVVISLVGFVLGACGTDEAPQNEAICTSDRGPAMARVQIEDDTFCIDRTEVTRAHYAAFVAAGAPKLAGMPAACANAESLPQAECFGAKSFAEAVCTAEGCGDHPQTCVTYCEAAAFCAWAGKELCTDKGGGYAVRGFDDAGAQLPVRGRWLAVCGQGFMPDGQPRLRHSSDGDYSPTRCNTESGRTSAVGSVPACTPAVSSEVFDIIGNVEEWNGLLLQGNRYETTVLNPIAFGGAAFGGLSGLSAACGASEVLDDVNQRSATIGFRCCKNAP